MIPEYFRYRCQSCKGEPKHTVITGKRTVELGDCRCKGGRHLEMVPLTQKKYVSRLTA